MLPEVDVTCLQVVVNSGLTPSTPPYKQEESGTDSIKLTFFVKTHME